MRYPRNKFKDKYRTTSTRLQNWDYASPGYYFVTICTKTRQSFFGEVVDGDMDISPVGEFAQRYWLEIPMHFANADLDEFVVMPNHVHGIVIIKDAYVETQHAASPQHAASLPPPKQQPHTPRKFGPLQPGSLSTIIRSYKSAVTRKVCSQGCEDFAWQSRFYDHIIRDDQSLVSILQYIRDNPQKWDLDEYNPDNLKSK